MSGDAFGWIHELARAEVHPDAERLLGLGSSLDPQALVEKSTLELLGALKVEFQEFLRIFNSYSEAGARFSEVKLYGVAQTASDFMLYRNQIKMVVSNSAHGIIQISFSEHSRTPFGLQEEPSKVSAIPAQELLAQMSPFREVFWTFQGEKVSAPEVARYYFAEFLRVSRNASNSKGSQKLLLDQIRTLLKEQGMEL
jgi:hypothetical protein